MSILRPMSDSEYASWSVQSIKDYAVDKVKSGDWAEAQSLELAQKEIAEQLPQGLHTPDHHFFTITNGHAESVGMLSFFIIEKFNAPVAFVYQIDIWPEHRRQGHATRAFLALEEESRRRGLCGIALHVFGHNASARAMYMKLGFLPTSVRLFKLVAPSEDKLLAAD